MSQVCPLLYRQIDATAARLGALPVMLLVACYLMTEHAIWLYLLGSDFLLRLYVGSACGPVYISALWLKKLLRLPTRMSDGGPKRLAAYMGLALTLLLLLADYAGLPLLGQIAGGIFLACAGLELLFDYCIGCRIYVWIRKIRFGGE